MRTACVIPARLDSVRLPRKVLLPLAGKPLIQHTFEKAVQAACFNRVIIACDDGAIVKAAEQFDGEAVLTSKHHESGTSRIAEAVEKLGFDLIVNLQADEPLVHPESLRQLVDGMKAGHAMVGTLATKNSVKTDYQSPNVVKVVLDHEGNALYFSRAPLPFGRDQAPDNFLKHLGIYAYRFDALMQFSRLKVSPLENIEKLEQLRFLWNGYKIRVWVTPHESIGVDTQADFDRVESMMKSGSKAPSAGYGEEVRRAN
ncbi:MAG: 3-deoxy-manno-octulosonate cytidylyltransferase [Candidatus Omnitrophica bacterium]|nr:3-deoxy-manno-octulosonate cytidylyltransferase [Candidatus Omnitrophota bacterium]